MANRVADRVAERFRNAPSYQELLAASAVAAAAAAESAAEAAYEAHAAAQAVLSNLQESQAAEAAYKSVQTRYDETDPFADPFFTQERRSPARTAAHAEEAAPAATENPVATLTDEMPARLDSQPRIEHHAPLPPRAPMPERTTVSVRTRALVDAFAEALVPAAQSLPAKLIEFPRELIATRKERPRLAEGPLREESSDGQIRIFEVEAEVATTVAEPTEERMREQPSMTGREETDRNERSHEEAPTPRRRGGFHFGREQAERQSQPARSGWEAIQLGEHPKMEAHAEPEPKTARRAEYGYREEAEPTLEEQAPLLDRFMSALVDFSLVGGCFLGSVLTFTTCTVHPPTGKAALIAGLVAFVAMAAFYGWLFMTFGGGSTPGMRYAKIALCTFGDENPTRRQMQNRVPATALAMLPLGLGVLWALLDEDRLGWHDRMTRTYQRSYR